MALILSGDTGPSFVQSAAMPTGSVIQTVSTSLSSTVSTSSTSFTATGLVASLTPTSSSSKVLVLLNGGTTTYDGSGPMFVAMYKQVASGGYSLLTNSEWISFASGNASYGYPHSFAYLDSPATTSTVYYQPYFKSGTGANLYFNYAGNNGVITITLMEIKV
jgi:hypothetical protein